MMQEADSPTRQTRILHRSGGEHSVSKHDTSSLATRQAVEYDPLPNRESNKVKTMLHCDLGAIKPPGAMDVFSNFCLFISSIMSRMSDDVENKNTVSSGSVPSCMHGGIYTFAGGREINVGLNDFGK